MGTDLSAKLQIRPGQSVAIVNQPDDLTIELDEANPPGKPASADAVIAFIRVSGDIDKHARPAIDAAKDDRVAWIAYPKAKQLDTDINRDTLNTAAKERGVRGVRQVSIDDIWSALRFRPA